MESKVKKTKRMSTHYFQIAVDCAIHDQAGEREVYYDCAFIALPESYCETGAATRLVINCHGAGGTVSTDDSQVEQQTLTKYLLANGYAVMDVNGLPKEFCEKYGIDIRNNIGCPIAVESYVKAYHYCIKRFNLMKEVFVHGGSMGGISSTNLVLSGRIPVIAQSGFCPVLDTYTQIFLNPWSGGLPREALGKIYCLEKDKNGEYVYDETRVAGFNPTARCIQENGKEYVHYPVAVKFWHCEDDATVKIESTKRFVEAINNAGGCAYLQTFPTGGHEPQDYGAFVKNPFGNQVFQREILKIKPAVEEAFLWIKSFDSRTSQ